METRATCGNCGTPLTNSLCPRCLLDVGLSPEPDEVPTPPDATPPLARLGDYELLEEIGRGGMGIVYRARQVSLDRIVAVKLLPFGGLGGPDVALRLRAEAVAAGSLRHPNIVAIHEVGLQQGQHFLVMDFVAGPSLARILRDGPLPAKRAATLVRQVALAVQHAHDRGIIHRDLKPSNILLDAADDQPRVTDFGLAKNLRSDTQLTLTGQTLGSPNYIPPEQIRSSRQSNAELRMRSAEFSTRNVERGTQNADSGMPNDKSEIRNPKSEIEESLVTSAATTAKISFASDVYALGAILYHALTGRPPFIGDDIAAVLQQVLHEEPLSPRALNPSVARDLETISLKCLEKEPARRYATVQALADELGRFLNSEPIQARPVTGVARAWRWCRRKPALACSLLLILILLCIVIIGSPVAAFRINRERHLAEAAQKNEAKLRQTAEAEFYTSDMNLVLKAWEDGNLKRAQDLLRAHIPKPNERDLRGFEWRYLWKLCQDESLRTIPCGTNGPVWRLATSPAHSFVAACGEKAVRLLDAATGRELCRFSYPNPEAKNTWHLIALASGATNLLAAHRADGVVGLWDISSNTLLTTFRPLVHGLSALALSPNGRGLAARDGRNLAMWDISRPTAPRHLWSVQLDVSFGPAALKFSPDGQTIVGNGKSSAAGTIGAWDVETGRELAPFPKHSVGFIIDVAFSPNGTLLAASGVQNKVNIWDFTNRIVRWYFEGHLGHVNALAFSPGGHRLISAGNDGTIRAWDIASRKAVGMFRDPHDRELISVVFAPDGKSILSTTGDELKIWSSEPRTPAAVIEARQEWGWPGVSPDGKWLVTIGAGQPGENYSESASAKVWDAASRQQKFYLIHKNRQPLPPTFSPDGKFFVVGGEDPDRVVGVWETALWDNATGPLKPMVSFTNEFEVGSISFSPDGKIMAIAGMAFNPEAPSRATNRLAFREVASWKKLNFLENAGAGATEKAAAATVAFSNDGRLLAVGYRDGWVRLWDFKQQRLLRELKVHDDDHFGMGVSFSPDSRWLASVSVGGPPKVVLFDLTDLEHVRPVLETKAHAGNSWSAIFTPDSRTLITSGGDGLIKFWNLETLKIALTLEHNAGLGVFLSLSRDGNLLVSQGADGTVKLWPAASLNEIAQTSTEAK